mgnify:CR=1 FL=1
MDKIIINNLEVFANHGVFPEENSLGQKFIISAVLYVDTRGAGLTDDLTQSVHYGEVCNLISKVTRENTFMLIERLAEVIAEEVLLTYDKIDEIDIEVKKPWAPIAQTLDYVAVSINRKWHTAYIGLGSNMGNKENNLKLACDRIAENHKCRLIKVSDFIVTEPVGGVEQDDFLNGAVCIETLYTPEELLDFTASIEAEAKRERIVHWGPRTLDLDILFYDDVIMHTDSLTVPHKELHKRLFVLEPMSGIAPYFCHPIYRRTMSDMFEELKKRD